MKSIDYKVCDDCFQTYVKSHRCSNPKPFGIGGLEYYQRRRQYLLSKRDGRWGDSDNDAADPEQQEPREA